MEQKQYATITIYVTADNITDEYLADLVHKIIIDVHESVESPLSVEKIFAQKTAELTL
jgi:hypothetical protein